MAFADAFYNAILKRNSVFVPTIFAGAFAFNIGFDIAISQFWDHWNRGRQWKDIRGRYIQDAEES
ncbi:ubiquinol-cytochrome C reductase UQCRX/QCR9-like protein [Pisolithus thermaeus]|nr:ubiquinol-cytochrome C reductase UQCRX/QCR9-like protein [Pisolithus thermaeus]